MKPNSNFTYSNRRTHGNHTIDHVNTLIQQNSEAAQALQAPLKWFQTGHNNFIKALAILNKEIADDERLTKLQLKIPTLVEEGIGLTFDSFELSRRKAKLKKDSEALEQVNLSIEQITSGKTKSALSSMEDKYVFVSKIAQQLSTHTALHYKDDDFELTKHVNDMWTALQAANKSLAAEKAETQEARRAVWKTAAVWDREYTSLKHCVRGVLRHLERSDNMNNYFLDLSTSSTSPSTEPNPVAEQE